jgi:predicted nucleic acid-binding protein
MTLGLDTSVVVRLLVGTPVDQALAARRAIESATRGSVAVSDLVIGEAYFALRHHYEVPHRKAIAALQALSADSRIRCTGVAGRVLANMPDKETGAGLMDRLIHGAYEFEGITLLTFDRDAGRLTGAQLVR